MIEAPDTMDHATIEVRAWVSNLQLWVKMHAIVYPCDTLSPFAYAYSVGYTSSWWRHQMETFSALLALCDGNSPVTGEFPAQRPVTRIFDVFFDLRPNKRLNKQSWGWWFETPSRPLWPHCNVVLPAINWSLIKFRRGFFCTRSIRVDITWTNIETIHALYVSSGVNDLMHMSCIL